MRLDKCVICKQQIKVYDHMVVLGYGIPDIQYAFCQSCAVPIIKFLRAHGIQSFTEAHKITWAAQHKDDTAV